MNIKKLTLLSMLFALALVLSFLESNFTPVIGVAPGVKIGLSNIIVMYAVLCLGSGYALCIAVLKSTFVLMTRGLIASLLSVCGGIGSVAVMTVLLKLFKDRISYISISLCGSITHNIIQFVFAMLITGTGITALYLPVLIVSGIFMGIVTGTTLSVVMPYLEKLN